MERHITLSGPIRVTCPAYRAGIIEARVRNTAHNARLWEEIEQEVQQIKSRYSLSDINKQGPIQATRQAYKAFGKDPNRYRPSAESLCRRIVKGLRARGGVIVDTDWERSATPRLDITLTATHDGTFPVRIPASFIPNQEMKIKISQ